MALRSKVNVFRQHQAACDGHADPCFMLCDYEAACIAHEIAEGFAIMSSHCQRDLERAEEFMEAMEKH